MAFSPLRILVRCYVFGVVLFLLLPIAIIVPLSFNSDRYIDFPPAGFSFQWYKAFFLSVNWRSSFWVSLEVALSATLISMALGVPAAFALVRGKIPLSRFLLGFFSLPIVFPSVVAGVALYYAFADLGLVGTRLGLALAHSLLALPVVILPTTAVLQNFDLRLEWQARNLGASGVCAFFTITVPIMKPCFLVTSLFAFATSFDEVVFSLFLSGGSSVTLPKRIWEGLRFDLEPTVTVVAAISVLLSLLVIAVALVQGGVLGIWPKGEK